MSHHEGPLPLLAAFLLEWGDASEVTIRTVAGAERRMAWVNNSFLLDIEDRLLLTKHFDWARRIAGTVPTFALDYARDYRMLPHVRDAVTGSMA